MLRLFCARTNNKQEIPRKYLGDSSDPHYTPNSPLISRQYFTPQEEGEIKRLCTLALAEVPHSDEMVDDPFRYMGACVVRKPDVPAKDEPLFYEEEMDEAAYEYDEPADELTELPLHLSQRDDTATPSEASKRGTMSTNDTSPWHTPAVTPGETGQRFSDAAKRSTSNTVNSGLRAELRNSRSYTEQLSMPSHIAMYAADDHLAVRSLSHLPQPETPRSTQSYNYYASIKRKPAPQVDLNKILPALPPSMTTRRQPAPTQQKSSGISRMLKTVKKPRRQPARPLSPKSASADVPRHVAQLAAMLPPPEKKSRINFSSLFSRKSHHTKRATLI